MYTCIHLAITHMHAQRIEQNAALSRRMQQERAHRQQQRHAQARRKYRQIRSQEPTGREVSGYVCGRVCHCVCVCVCVGGGGGGGGGEDGMCVCGRWGGEGGSRGIDQKMWMCAHVCVYLWFCVFGVCVCLIMLEMILLCKYKMPLLA